MQLTSNLKILYLLFLLSSLMRGGMLLLDFKPFLNMKILLGISIIIFVFRRTSRVSGSLPYYIFETSVRPKENVIFPVLLSLLRT